MYTILVECWTGAFSFYNCSYKLVSFLWHDVDTRDTSTYLRPNSPSVERASCNVVLFPKPGSIRMRDTVIQSWSLGCVLPVKQIIRLSMWGKGRRGVLGCNIELKLEVIYEDTDLGYKTVVLGVLVIICIHLTQCTTGKHYLYNHGHKLKHVELGKFCVTTR